MSRGKDAHTNGKFNLSQKGAMEIMKLFMTKGVVDALAVLFMLSQLGVAVFRFPGGGGGLFFRRPFLCLFFVVFLGFLLNKLHQLFSDNS